ITFRSSEIAPYANWKNCNSDYIGVPSHKLIAIGCGGILYPPHCLYEEEAFNLDDILACVPRADDLWLKMMETMNDTPVVLAKRYTTLDYIESTQEIRLCDDNVSGNQNDIQFKNALGIYKKFPDHIPFAERLLSKDDAVPACYIDKNKLSVSILQPTIDKLKKSLESEKKKPAAVHTDDTVMKNLALEQEQTKLLEAKLDEVSNELVLTRKSLSFRVGRFITWLPRKLRNLFKRDET
ncbi:MAG: hypothetical protein K2J80_10085, partial [Oscillospiraceae bacterium]|nr:hypothetical protein [Oscillospiraceae bacterium]